jgi:hypothetical protein
MKENEFLATITKFTNIDNGIRHMTEYVRFSIASLGAAISVSFIQLKEVDLKLVKSDHFLGYGSIAAWAKVCPLPASTKQLVVTFNRQQKTR